VARSPYGIELLVHLPVAPVRHQSSGILAPKAQGQSGTHHQYGQDRAIEVRR